MKVFNTLTRKKETFSPINAPNVGLYSCGPTVYHYAHIGNHRATIFADLLKRVLTFNNYKVKHVVNITDVGHLTSDADQGEDKMLKGAKREGKTVYEIAEYYTQAFKNDLKELNIIEPDIWSKATEHIKQQIEMVEKLEKNGFTYTSGGNVYFDTSKCKDYGKLARLNLEAEQKSRVEKDPNKKNKNDFVLWFTKSKFLDQEMKWESPWGEGYPGWHIECSAMSSHYLGEQFDIHTGGRDLMPIHHTNEIAQSECAFNKKPWVKYWMHNEFLVMGKGIKMSKSDNEGFITLNFLKNKGYHPLSYKYHLLGTVYRKPTEFTYEALDASQNAYNKLKHKVLEMLQSPEQGEDENVEPYIEAFQVAINDDLNTPKALAAVWDMLKNEKLKNKKKYKTILEFDHVLGLGLNEIDLEELPEEIKLLMEKREHARLNKDWGESDKLRDEIQSKGYIVKDSKEGTKCTKA
jgi:cysteinyl-tRNA synthetase